MNWITRVYSFDREPTKQINGDVIIGSAYPITELIREKLQVELNWNKKLINLYIMAITKTTYFIQRWVFTLRLLVK
jgi:hypothetical protein